MRDLVARHAGDLQPKGEVPLCRHARVERVGLEHHADAAILAGSSQVTFLSPIQIWPASMSSSPAMALSSVDLPQPDASEEDDELALLDLEVEVLEHLQVAEARRRVCGLKRWPSDQPFTAPAAMPRTNSLPETK